MPVVTFVMRSGATFEVDATVATVERKPDIDGNPKFDITRSTRGISLQFVRKEHIDAIIINKSEQMLEDQYMLEDGDTESEEETDE